MIKNKPNYYYYWRRDGPYYKVPKGVILTKGLIVDVIDQLHSKFGKDEYEFVPEAITEGGIEWRCWPGKPSEVGEDDISQYKTIRFRSNRGNWSFVDAETVMSDWRQNPTIIYEDSSCIYTVLKSQQGAPEWTVEEVDIFDDVLSSVLGLKRFRMSPLQLKKNRKKRKATTQLTKDNTN